MQFWQVESEYRAIQQRVAARAGSKMAKWVLVAALALGQLVLGCWAGLLDFWRLGDEDWETKKQSGQPLLIVFAGVGCCVVDAYIILWLCQPSDDDTRNQKLTAEMERRHLVRGRVAEPAGAAEKEAADLAATRLFNGRESIEVP
jgi:hypothetical protein